MTTRNQNTATPIRGAGRTLLCGAVLLALAGCASLLPSGDMATELPFASLAPARIGYSLEWAGSQQFVRPFVF